MILGFYFVSKSLIAFPEEGRLIWVLRAGQITNNERRFYVFYNWSDS